MPKRRKGADGTHGEQPARRARTDQNAGGTQPGTDTDHLSYHHMTALTQFMLREGSLREHEAKVALRRILGVNHDYAYSEVLDTINKNIKFLAIELITFKYPVTGEKYIVLVNRAQDDGSKLGTKYTHPQREFFKDAVEFIAQQDLEDGFSYQRASNIQLKNLAIRRDHAATQAAGTTQTQAGTSAAGAATQAPAGTQAVGTSRPAAVKALNGREKDEALGMLARDGWLHEASGYYSLGVRTLAELMEYLRSLDGVPDAVRAVWDEIL